MLEVCNIKKKPSKKHEDKTSKDVIITKYKIETIENEDGTTTIKRIPVNVNITKKVNETKKMIKNYTAEEKLAELEKVFTK